MQSVKVKKAELLEALIANRTAHRAIFEEALVGSREAVIEELEKRLSDARKGKRVSDHLGLVQPMDQTKEYDRAIKMVSMSTEDVIELSDADFACFVMDDWRWKDQFTASNIRYTKAK